MQTLSMEWLAACRQRWQQDPAAQAATRALTQAGPLSAALSIQAVRALPYTFSIDLEEDGVTDQGQSLRCWTFASLNPVRQHMARTLNIKARNFELSQNYLYFFDQLEKCGRFLDEIIHRVEEEPDSDGMLKLLRQPVADNGQWYIFARLAKKYGVVPKHLMPDTHCSPDTRHVTFILGSKLRLCAMQLREAYAQCGNRQTLQAMRDRQLEEIYGILCRFLGPPPTHFTFEYRDGHGTYHRIEDITPQDFFSTYGDTDPDDYIMLIHHPSHKRPFMQPYYLEDHTGIPPQRPDPAILLNVDLPLFKQATIAQLAGGEQVVMGCDVTKQSSKSAGLMDAALYEYEALFGTQLMMNKADRILYKGTCGTHIMSFSGVNLLPNGRPDRWKVQNSYGQAMGIEGHYVMADNWFDEYVLSVVIRKCYAHPSLLEAYEKTPVAMKFSEWY